MTLPFGYPYRNDFWKYIGRGGKGGEWTWMSCSDMIGTGA